MLIDERGFECAEGWPSVYVKRFNAIAGSGTGSAAASLVPARPGVLLIIAYVGDLLFLGTKEVWGEIEKIRGSIKMDDPTPIKKISGLYSPRPQGDA